MPRRFRVIRGGEAAEPRQQRSGLQGLPTFEEALVTYLDSLFPFALRLVKGQRAQAEDLVQETCLRAWKNYQSVRSPERLKSWFFRILVNTHINEFHRQSHQTPILDVELSEALLGSEIAEHVPTPEESLFAELLDTEIQQALDDLPVEFRTAVWLADAEELSYEEISEIMNCPMGTVASRLYRGHSLLRSRLREFAQRRGIVRE